jgi:hypothetical protein
MAWLALLAAVGCSGGAEQRPPPAPQRQAALPPSAPEPVEDAASRRAHFCGELARVIDAESGGFVALRGSAVGEASWSGRMVPVGLRDCEVQGDYYPGASYVCRGESLAGGSGELLVPSYQELAEDVRYCLEQPIWFPRIWRQGQDFEFAGGERQTIWRDGSSGPKPTVALKIEEDLAGRYFYLRLAVASDR